MVRPSKRISKRRCNSPVHPNSTHRPDYAVPHRLCGWNRKSDATVANDNHHVLRWISGNRRNVRS